MTIPEIAGQLAGALGGEVEETCGDSYARVLRPEGVVIVFRGERDRVKVTAGIPAVWQRIIGHHAPWAIPSISFSAARSIDDMYDEVRRRLWPAIVTAYAEAEKAYHGELDRRDSVKGAAATIAATLGTTAQESGYGAQDGYRVYTYRGPHDAGPSTQWRPYHYSSKGGLRSEIRMDVPHELALAIARTIADYEAAR